MVLIKFKSKNRYDCPIYELQRVRTIKYFKIYFKLTRYKFV